MTFEFVRWNGPNVAAIVALAAVPMVALATLSPSDTGQSWPSETAAICQTAGCTMIASAPDSAVE
jgi:hypothetical protein